MLYSGLLLQVIEFVKKHVGSEKSLLAGNSVYVDFLFLKVARTWTVSSLFKAKQLHIVVINLCISQKYMPDLAALFPHTLVDVSSVKALCFRWFPRGKIFKKPCHL